MVQGIDKRRRDDLDAFKGLLIVLVVLGHNTFFSRYFDLWFSYLYTFHVACFLLLPFFLARGMSAMPGLWVRVCRLLVPHFAFLAVAASLFYILFVQKDWASTSLWLGALGRALVVQNEECLNAASGFRHFWFLPAIFGLSLWLWLYSGLKVHAGRLLLVSASLAYLWGWTLVPVEVARAAVPWGTASMAYVILPGLAIRWIGERVAWTKGRDLVLVLVWIALFSTLASNRWIVIVTGYAPFPVLGGSPGLVVFHYLFLVVSFFLLFRVAWYLRGTPLREIGRVSLQVFLLHPLIWQAFRFVGGERLGAEGTLGRLSLIALSLTVTLVLSYVVARLIAATSLGLAIFPRSPAEFRDGWCRLWWSVRGVLGRA